MTQFRTFDHALVRQFKGPAGVYAYILLCVSFVLGFWLQWQSAALASIAIPLICFGLIFTQFELFSFVLLVLLFAVSAETSYGWFPSVFGPIGMEEAWFCILIMALIISALRYLALVYRIFPKAAGTVQHQPRNHQSYRQSELRNVGLEAVVCCMASGVLLVFIDQNTQSAREYGLLPHGLRAVKATLTVFLFFLISQGLLSYRRWRSLSRMESRMHLQYEFWRWCGPEQRIITRQRMRHQRKA